MAQKDDLANVDNVEIEPLTDQDLDSVAGGDSNTCYCSNCPTFGCPPKPVVVDEQQLAQ